MSERPGPSSTSLRDEPVDLDNCAREPIHVPGQIQPRGVLVVVRERDGVVVQASANLPDRLGPEVAGALGAPLSTTLGEDAANEILRHASATSDLAARNPLTVRLPDGTLLDAVLHRPPAPEPVPGAEFVRGDEPVLVVELESAGGARPLAFPNTYLAVRGALGRIERAMTLQELYDVTARQVRELTGFDRVMIYRFDDRYDGEVVAEARRDDLNAFLGLRYPASDIPPQARALYEKNWIRLIADVGYTPSPLVPTLLPTTGRPLDLTCSTLRSVSPVHVEYLQNMGVSASMSISLLRDGRLWGLIACHHYDGPHEPPYEVRAAAEFLGAALSVRLVAQAEEEQEAEARRSARILAHLVADSRDEEVQLDRALTRDDRLLRLVRADGAFVLVGGVYSTVGAVPDDAGLTALTSWVLATADDEVTATDALGETAPDVAALAPDVAGVLGVVLPDGQVVVWVRSEVLRTVDWGGDPHNKAIARREGPEVRLSPRRSFERWRETVSGHSSPWTADQLESAAALRGHLVEALYVLGLRAVRATESLQRSLLPASLPAVAGWEIDARYESAGSGLVGGDWYDAIELPSGRLALVVGDVTGHGLQAAATMGQLRTTLRAALVATGSATAAARVLADVARWTMPEDVATVAVVVLDPADGQVEHVLLGHPPLLVVEPDGSSRWTEPAAAPPLGMVEHIPEARTVVVPPGGALVLYSDGLVEWRTESIRAGLDRLAGAFARGADVDVGGVVLATRDPRSADDATLLRVLRSP